MSKAKITLEKFSTLKYRMIFEGIIVGLITGFLVAIFRLAIEHAETLRRTLYSDENPRAMAVLFIVMLAGTLVVWAAAKLEPHSSGSGIPQVKGELVGDISQSWYRVISAKLAGATTAIGLGLSLGREGPSIQLGAMIGKGLSKVTKKLPIEEKMLITCGAGAGLAGAFCAPLAGVVFALEELHKNFSTEILLSTMSASVVSNFIASSIFGLEPVFKISIAERLPLRLYWMIVILGVVLGILGKVYNRLMMTALNLYDLISSKLLRIVIAVALAAVLGFVFPQALGSGHFLVEQIAYSGNTLGLGSETISFFSENTGHIIKIFLLLFVTKLFFSAVSFGSGAPGGIFLPLLVLGAIAGGGFSVAVGKEFYIANFVIIGMTGLFASIVRAPITGVILITEMTGDFSNFLPLAVVALVSYVIADITGASPIYDELLERNVAKNLKGDEANHRFSKKVLVEGDVYFGSKMDGQTIADMELPAGSLVISVERGQREIVPDGSTRLQGGDKIVLLCAEDYHSQIAEILDSLCKRIDR